MTSILKCAVLALSVTLTATLQAKSYDSTQMNCLAQNAYHEARGEGEKGMLGTIFVATRVRIGARAHATGARVCACVNNWWVNNTT